MADPPAGADDVAGNRYARLVRSSARYEVTRLPNGASATFPLTDEGSDAAWERYRSLTRSGRVGRALSLLAPAAVVAACLWFVFYFVGLSLGLLLGDGDEPFAVRLLLGAAAYGSVFFDLFLACTGCYVALWLYRRGLPPTRQA